MSEVRACVRDELLDQLNPHHHPTLSTDDLDSLNNSLLDMQARLPKNQINMKVTGGQRGAPFAMGITAIWTKQQVSWGADTEANDVKMICRVHTQL